MITICTMTADQRIPRPEADANGLDECLQLIAGMLNARAGDGHTQKRRTLNLELVADLFDLNRIDTEEPVFEKDGVQYFAFRRHR